MIAASDARGGRGRPDGAGLLEGFPSGASPAAAGSCGPWRWLVSFYSSSTFVSCSTTALCTKFWVSAIRASAITQTGLAVVCFRRYPRARVPAAFACLALCYLLFATLGPDCLAALHRASSFDPVADWIDLAIQHIFVTGGLFAAACAANMWLRFPVPAA